MAAGSDAAAAARIRNGVQVPGRNVLVVRVDANVLDEGWFYEGAGIYRHAWLTKMAPAHIARWVAEGTPPDMARRHER